MNTRSIIPGLLFGSLTLAASAQRADLQDRNTVLSFTRTVHETLSPQISGERGGGSVVWSEDFSNGMAGSNPSGAWTTSGPNGNIWKIGTTAPIGTYTTANQLIQSTTFQNGFAKFASDSANSSWVGNTPSVLPAGQITNWEGSLVSPVIDLSSNPMVEVVYQQSSRFCCNTTPFFFEVSTDGNTWTSFTANEGLPVNQDPTTTETRRFNISTLITENPNAVQFRFRHSSEAGSSHYQWQVDDIQITILPEYEIRMNYAYTSTTGTGEEYGRIAATQLPAALNIGAEVLNYGSQTQTNVSVECVVRNATGNVVLTNNTILGDLTSGQSAISDAFVDLPFLDLGRYEATFSIVSDQLDEDAVTTDNSLKRNFEITLDQYSLDALGNHPAGTEVRQQLGTSSFADNTTVNVLTMYDITTSTLAHSATIILGSNTRAGNASRIEVFLLDTVDVLTTPSSISFPVNGVRSEIVTVTQAHVSAGRITIPFEQPVSLSPNAYYLCASITGSGTTTPATDAEVFIADDNTVPQPGLSSMIYLPIDWNDDGTEGRHLYGNGNAAAVRLNITPAVGIAENEDHASVSMYPNPTNGSLNIVSDVQGLMNVEVTDVLGAVARTASFNGRTTLDLTGLAHGIYTVRVSNGKHTTVERITLH